MILQLILWTMLAKQVDVSTIRQRAVEDFKASGMAKSKSVLPYPKSKVQAALSGKISRIETAALEFWLCQFPDGKSHVARMLKTADWDPETIDYLPGALDRIYEYGNSELVVTPLLHLRLDGAWAEELAGVDHDCLIKNPKPIAAALRKYEPNPRRLFHPTMRPEITEQLCFMYPRDKGLKKLRIELTHTQDKDLQYLYKYLRLMEAATKNMRP